jgi:hypothetical protein
MKIIVNGEEKYISVLYGLYALVGYETVVKMAGYDPEKPHSVRFQDNEASGTLIPGDKARVSISRLPVFEVVPEEV